VSRGSYGFVYLSKKDILRLSKYTDLSIKDFIKLYCEKTYGFVHFKERRKNSECQFLEKKRCSIYKARPTQCRTWPFWSENMKTKIWNEEIQSFCPGIGKGKIIQQSQIEKNINDDKKNEDEMINEVMKS
jgi:hypothetical protein